MQTQSPSMNQAPKPRRNRRSLVLAFAGVVLVWALVITLLLQRQALSDWYRLHGYEPSAEIVALADRVAMTDEARKLWYVNDPQIEQAASFNEHCRDGEYTIVLGCYIGGDGGIYVFDVDDDRLAGIQEVTAAHEMLHAAYERLSSSEKRRIDALTAAAFNGLSDARINETIEQYRAQDESIVANELHSILGSEVASLPAELEAYYAQYFSDRSAVVGFATQYAAAFETRKALIADYELQLRAKQDEITARSEALTQDAAELADRRAALEASRGNADTATFNANARSYNAAVDAYNREVAAVSKLIDSYNELYEAYSAVAAEQQDLFEAIDSRPESLP